MEQVINNVKQKKQKRRFLPAGYFKRGKKTVEEIKLKSNIYQNNKENAALEISQNKNKTVYCLKPFGLVAYYKCTEGTGSILHDSSGCERTATIKNEHALSEWFNKILNKEIIKTNKEEKIYCLQLNGKSKQYIEIPSDDCLELLGGNYCTDENCIELKKDINKNCLAENSDGFTFEFWLGIQETDIINCNKSDKTETTYKPKQICLIQKGDAEWNIDLLIDKEKSHFVINFKNKKYEFDSFSNIYLTSIKSMNHYWNHISIIFNLSIDLLYIVLSGNDIFFEQTKNGCPYLIFYNSLLFPTNIWVESKKKLSLYIGKEDKIKNKKTAEGSSIDNQKMSNQMVAVPFLLTNIKLFAISRSVDDILKDAKYILEVKNVEQELENQTDEEDEDESEYEEDGDDDNHGDDDNNEKDNYGEKTEEIEEVMFFEKNEHVVDETNRKNKKEKVKEKRKLKQERKKETKREKQKKEKREKYSKVFKQTGSYEIESVYSSINDKKKYFFNELSSVSVNSNQMDTSHSDDVFITNYENNDLLGQKYKQTKWEKKKKKPFRVSTGREKEDQPLDLFEKGGDAFKVTYKKEYDNGNVKNDTLNNVEFFHFDSEQNDSFNNLNNDNSLEQKFFVNNGEYSKFDDSVEDTSKCEENGKREEDNYVEFRSFSDEEEEEEEALGEQVEWPKKKERNTKKKNIEWKKNNEADEKRKKLKEKKVHKQLKEEQSSEESTEEKAKSLFFFNSTKNDTRAEQVNFSFDALSEKNENEFQDIEGKRKRKKERKITKEKSDLEKKGRENYDDAEEKEEPDISMINCQRDSDKENTKKKKKSKDKKKYNTFCKTLEDTTTPDEKVNIKKSAKSVFTQENILTKNSECEEKGTPEKDQNIQEIKKKYQELLERREKLEQKKIRDEIKEKLKMNDKGFLEKKKELERFIKEQQLINEHCKEKYKSNEKEKLNDAYIKEISREEEEEEEEEEGEESDRETNEESGSIRSYNREVFSNSNDPYDIGDVVSSSGAIKRKQYSDDNDFYVSNKVQTVEWDREHKSRQKQMFTNKYSSCVLTENGYSRDKTQTNSKNKITESNITEDEIKKKEKEVGMRVLSYMVPLTPYEIHLIKKLYHSGITLELKELRNKQYETIPMNRIHKNLTRNLTSINYMKYKIQMMKRLLKISIAYILKKKYIKALKIGVYNMSLLQTFVKSYCTLKRITIKNNSIVNLSLNINNDYLAVDELKHILKNVAMNIAICKIFILMREFKRYQYFQNSAVILVLYAYLCRIIRVKRLLKKILLQFIRTLFIRGCIADAQIMCHFFLSIFSKKNNKQILENEEKEEDEREDKKNKEFVMEILEISKNFYLECAVNQKSYALTQINISHWPIKKCIKNFGPEWGFYIYVTNNCNIFPRNIQYNGFLKKNNLTLISKDEYASVIQTTVRNLNSVKNNHNSYIVEDANDKKQVGKSCYDMDSRIKEKRNRSLLSSYLTFYNQKPKNFYLINENITNIQLCNKTINSNLNSFSMWECHTKDNSDKVQQLMSNCTNDDYVTLTNFLGYSCNRVSILGNCPYCNSMFSTFSKYCNFCYRYLNICFYFFTFCSQTYRCHLCNITYSERCLDIFRNGFTCFYCGLYFINKSTN